MTDYIDIALSDLVDDSKVKSSLNWFESISTTLCFSSWHWLTKLNVAEMSLGFHQRFEAQKQLKYVTKWLNIYKILIIYSVLIDSLSNLVSVDLKVSAPLCVFKFSHFEWLNILFRNEPCLCVRLCVCESVCSSVQANNFHNYRPILMKLKPHNYSKIWDDTFLRF